MTACAFCGNPVKQPAGAINRAVKRGLPIYCDRECAGMARRAPMTMSMRKQQKREYDIAYRAMHADRLKAQKAKHYQLTRDPEKERAVRKARMHLHVAYCRRPEYREWKKQYDKQRKAKQNFGEFAEAALVLESIESEIDARATRYEVGLQNKTINKAQTRRRAL